MYDRDLCDQAVNEMIQVTMDLYEESKLTSEEFNNIIDKLHKVVFVVNTRLTRVIARAFSSGKIEIGKTLLYSTDEFFYQTMIHELLHVIDRAKHGKSHSHREEYIQLGELYGFTYEVTKPKHTPRYKDELMVNKVRKYTVICEGCHAEWKYNRKNRFIETYSNPEPRKTHYKCKKCGSKEFKVIQHY